MAAETGIAQPRISRLEHAVEIPTVTTLLRILRALNAIAEFGPNEIKIRPVVTAEARPNREQQAGDGLHQRAES
jgi:transcriptional regulator with XRE-family HTH domain